MDRLRTLCTGEMLWAVSEGDEAPLRAFSKLGIVNLAGGHLPQDQHRKHLLTRPQHHALQQLLAAATQRHLSAFPLEELLGGQDRFVAGLLERLTTSTREMGIRLEDLQILQIRPADSALLQQLGASSSEGHRERASRIHVETEERIKLRAIATDTSLALEQIKAEEQRELRQAQSALAIEAEKTELLRRQLELDRRRLAHQAEFDQLAAEQEHQSRVQDLQRSHALATSQERDARELSRHRRARAEEELDGQLAAKRASAEAERDAALTLARAEEQKSAVLREHELSRFVTERVTDALAKLPLKDARWITVGESSPLSFCYGAAVQPAGGPARGRPPRAGASPARGAEEELMSRAETDPGGILERRG